MIASQSTLEITIGLRPNEPLPSLHPNLTRVLSLLVLTAAAFRTQALTIYISDLPLNFPCRVPLVGFLVGLLLLSSCAHRRLPECVCVSKISRLLLFKVLCQKKSDLGGVRGAAIGYSLHAQPFRMAASSTVSCPKRLLLWAVLLVALPPWILPGVLVNASNLPSDSEHHHLRGSTKSIKVFGTVFCDSCWESRLTDNSIVLTDAKVLVECKTKAGQVEYSTVVNTSKTGEFKVEVPAHVRDLTTANACSARLLSKPMDSCNISSVLHDTHYSDQLLSTQGPHNFVYKPREVFSFCPKSQALSLGPPDPPQPSSFKSAKSYHLGPPDPPRPTAVVSKSYRLGPPNPPQPVSTPRHG